VTREIVIANDTKIIIEPITRKYYAIQSKDGYKCSHFHTIEKFITKEEAIKRLDEKAKDYLEKNKHFMDHKVVFIEEIEMYSGQIRQGRRKTILRK
jgi:hypothetical protein